MRSIKIVAFSDPHQRYAMVKVPDGDIVICSGDISMTGNIQAVTAFCHWYGELPHKHKILIAGNHDWLFENDPALGRQICKDNGIIYLEDSGVEIEGIKFWGSPVTPWFNDWAFNRAITDMEATYRNIRPIKPYWDMIPDDTDVLITHGPPYDILDELLAVDGTPKGIFVGCPELLAAVKRVKPQCHFFGHIHCGYGEKHIDGTSFYNTCVLDEMYMVSNPVTIVDYVLEEGT